MRLRSFTTIAGGTVGVFLGLLGAAFFNLAGLDLRQGRLKSGLAWENGESEYGVFLGCALLLLGFVSVVGAVLLSHVKQPDRRLRILGKAVAGLSLVIVMGLTLVSIAVLPRFYDWTAS